MSSKKIKIGTLMSVGIDIGKDVFHLVGFDPDGNVVVRKRSNGWRWKGGVRPIRSSLSLPPKAGTYAEQS